MAQLIEAGAEGESVYHLRPLRGHVISEQRLAAAPGPVITLVVGIACLALGLSVFWKGDASETAAGFWPPAGAALVALLVVPFRRWGWVFAGIIVPTVLGLALGLAPLSAALWWAAGNCVEPAAAAILLRRLTASKRLSSDHGLLPFFAIAVLAAPMLGGAIGTVGTVVGYGAPWFDVWRDWVISDGLGVLVITPLLLNHRPSRPVNRRSYEVAVLVAVVTVSVGLTFANMGDNGAALLPYMILVGMVWAGMRFGTRAAAAAGFVVALAANVATTFGHGPFSNANRTADIITVQIFLAIALVTSLVAASMASELADRDEVSRLLAYQANHDALTGLPNRILFVESLNEALDTDCEETASGVGVLVIDLDDFKKFNDRHGHPAGDQALCSAAALLAQSVGPCDFLARLGGDAFIVLCTGLDGPEALNAAATRMALSLAPGVVVGANQYPLSVSIGAALVGGDDPIEAADLLHRADIAFYHAKRTPGLSIALFDDALEEHTRRRVEIAEELRHSIDRGEMSVLFQPMISIETGQLVEFEALLRWNNRRFGSVGPDEFIPVAEDDGFIDALGVWVLEVACTQLAAWRAQPSNEPGDGIRIAVNVSARQLSDETFASRVDSILAAAHAPASALTLEITETAVMYDSEASDLVLTNLRRMGVRLSMDDFGTGHSSMSNLQRSPLDVLKIDRSFVAGVGKVAKDTAIVASIIELGHSFGLNVVAEGIETWEQLENLARLGCDHGQGYFWSRAVDACTATSMIHKSFQVPAMTVLPARADLDDTPVATMLRGLLRIRSAEEAAELLQQAAEALGGSLIPAADAGPNAISLDLSLGNGSAVFVEAEPMTNARVHLERFLPKLTEDAHEAVDLLRHNERIKDASNTDRLTGLANRRVLDRVLPRAKDGAIIVIDLDHFKLINDTAGHHAGDVVLATFGQMLRREARASDVCCRFGGEEFVIIAADTSLAEAVDLTTRLRQAWVRASPRPVTFSAGIAAIGIGIAGGRDALSAADRALYRAKELGRDRTETEFLSNAHARP